MRLSRFQLPSFATALMVLLLAGTAFAQTSAAGRVLTIDDILGLARVSSPAISPDGAWVAYVVEQVDADKDEKRSSIRMVSSDGSETVQLTSMERSAWSPAWSPDGRYISFLSGKADDEDAKTQVWTLDRRGGEPQAYTSVDQARLMEVYDRAHPKAG